MVNSFFLPRSGVNPVIVTTISICSPESIRLPDPVSQVAVQSEEAIYKARSASNYVITMADELTSTGSAILKALPKQT